MRCKNCGTRNSKDARFCVQCGQPLTTPKSGKGRLTGLIVAIIALLLVTVLAVILIAALPKLLEPEHGPRVSADGSYVFDETVLEEIDASDPAALQSVDALVEGLAQRGFEGYTITAPYDASGSFREDEAIDPAEGGAYPLYIVDYVTADGNYWTILVCGGAYMANPVFTYGSHWPQLLLVEDDYVTAYDSAAGTFYQTVPGERELDVKKVDRIDATTIEALDAEGIEAL